MIRTLHRVRGASALGARGPGESGPYGRWPDDLEDAEPDEDDVDGGLDDEDDQDHDDPQPERAHMPNSLNADQWNARYPIGTPVTAYPGARPEDDPNGERLKTTTRSRAQLLGGHTDVVWVEGHSACIALTHVDPTD